RRHRPPATAPPGGRTSRKTTGARKTRIRSPMREGHAIELIHSPQRISGFSGYPCEALDESPTAARAVAEKTSPTTSNTPKAKFEHVGDKCSFDAFIAEYKLAEPGLDKLADIVRGADTSRPDLTPQSHGLLAISTGLGQVYADDHEMLRHGMVMYDALYAWCR